MEKILKGFLQSHTISVLREVKKMQNIFLSQFKKWGWDAQIETFHVLFPTPKTRVLEMTSPTSYKALLKEPALKEDATSASTTNCQLTMHGVQMVM